jgi:hypothetical protein
MRLHSLLLLFLTIPIAGSQSSHGSLRLQLSHGPDRPLQKVPVSIRFESSSGLRYPLEVQSMTDSSGVLLIEELPVAKVTIHLEIAGLDDYSADVILKAGETTTVATQLEPVEDIPLVRLPDVHAREFSQACRQRDFRNTRSTFESAKEWTALWSELKLSAPTVNFNRWRIVAYITRSSESGDENRIRRITYNPARKVIRVRRNFYNLNLEFRLPVISCTADFVLIPHRDGEVVFR